MMGLHKSKTHGSCFIPLSASAQAPEQDKCVEMFLLTCRQLCNVSLQMKEKTTLNKSSRNNCFCFSELRVAEDTLTVQT